MFIATIINFLLLSLSTGIQIAAFIFFFRKALILDINYPLPEKRMLVNNVLSKFDMGYLWAGYLPVSISYRYRILHLIHSRWRCCSAISL